MDSSNARYAKQIKVSYFGEQAQHILSHSHVAIVGLGALGSTVAELLTRSGVGTLTLIDRDYIELSNLQRQQLYTEQDVDANLPKAIAAFNRLTAINSTIKIIPIISHLNRDNIHNYLQDAQIIIDATDNLRARYLINEYATREQKTWIHGAVTSTYGRVLTITPFTTPCFKCIYPDSPELDGIDTCDTVGVLNTAVNVIASMQATEALKYLIGKHNDSITTIIEFDIWQQSMFKIDVTHAKNNDCPVCAHLHYQLLDDEKAEQQSSILCGRNTVQTYHYNLNANTYDYYIDKIKHKSELQQNKYLAKLLYHDYIITFFPDGRCLVQGCTDISEAENLVSVLFDI